MPTEARRAPPCFLQLLRRQARRPVEFCESDPLTPTQRRTLVHSIGARVLGLGIGYSGSKIHSPNEHIVISHLESGIRVIKRALEKFAGL